MRIRKFSLVALAIMLVALAIMLVACGEKVPTLVPTSSLGDKLEVVYLVEEVIPTWTVSPTQIPLPTKTLVPLQEDVSFEPTVETKWVSDASFETYLRDSYSSVGGYPIEIEDVLVIWDDDPLYPFRVVSLDVSYDSYKDFWLQPEAATAAYADLLWEDVKTYFGGRISSLFVQHVFYSDDVDWVTTAYNNDWVHMGNKFNTNLGGWQISLYVVQGHIRSDGRESLRTVMSQ